jgi:peptidoglycan-N-acetylglucosamine deacetylase
MRVALTFDAEHPDRVHRVGVHDSMLDVLADREVHATFFLQGRWVEANPEAALRVASEGHLIGSHSFYHVRLPLLSDNGLVTDVRDAERAIRDIVGVDPRPWFRCPFNAGEDDPRVVAALTGLGYQVVPVDVVLEDWEASRSGPAIAADAVAAVDRLAEEGATEAIVLLHTWPPQALDSLPAMIDGMRRGGAAFVDVAALGSARWIASA